MYLCLEGGQSPVKDTNIDVDRGGTILSLQKLLCQNSLVSARASLDILQQVFPEFFFS